MITFISRLYGNFSVMKIPSDLEFRLKVHSRFSSTGLLNTLIEQCFMVMFYYSNVWPQSHILEEG